jgi:hypothetical protein
MKLPYVKSVYNKERTLRAADPNSHTNSFRGSHPKLYKCCSLTILNSILSYNVTVKNKRIFTLKNPAHYLNKGAT